MCLRCRGYSLLIRLIRIYVIILHQWYWSIQYPDFLNLEDEFIEFDSYLVPESDLEDGALRMLEVDCRVVLPELTHVRFIITSGD